MNLLPVAWPRGRVGPDVVGGAGQVLSTLERGLAQNRPGFRRRLWARTLERAEPHRGTPANNPL